MTLHKEVIICHSCNRSIEDSPSKIFCKYCRNRIKRNEEIKYLESFFDKLERPIFKITNRTPKSELKKLKDLQKELFGNTFEQLVKRRFSYLRI